MEMERSELPQRSEVRDKEMGEGERGEGMVESSIHDNLALVPVAQPPATPPPLAPARVIYHPQCKVCTHEEREDIEEEYLKWTSVEDILSGRNISDKSLSNHARHAGLREKRMSNWKVAVQVLLERSLKDSTIKVTGDTALRAAQLLGEAAGDIKRGTVVNNNDNRSIILPSAEAFLERMKQAEQLKGGAVDVQFQLVNNGGDGERREENGAEAVGGDNADVTDHNEGGAGTLLSVDGEEADD